MNQHTFYADNLIDVLREEGIPASQIWELDGWKTNEQGYYWTDPFTDQHHGYDGVASGHLNHHTASLSYTPFVKNSAGQTKCNVWVGKRHDGRLYQNHTSGVPTLAIASAGPADYSAGSGVRGYIKKLFGSIEALKQTAPDDVPTFYGNRYVWNTEVVCDGVGGMIDQDTWDLLIAYNTALSRLHDGEAAFNGFHAGFTRRKIDYRDGRFHTAALTIQEMWRQITDRLGAPMSRYPDVPPDHIFHDDIEWLATTGITKVPEGADYRPDEPVTRGEMAAFIHRHDKYINRQETP